MGTRQKLNRVYMTGSLLIAGVAGLATDSVTVFMIALAALAAIARARFVRNATADRATTPFFPAQDRPPH